MPAAAAMSANRFAAGFDDGLRRRRGGDIGSRRRLPSQFAMQDGETLGAHAETRELLWNLQSKPAKLAGLGPKRLIERVLAVDERMHLGAAASLRQNAGDALPQRIES